MAEASIHLFMLRQYFASMTDMVEAIILLIMQVALVYPVHSSSFFCWQTSITIN